MITIQKRFLAGAIVFLSLTCFWLGPALSQTITGDVYYYTDIMIPHPVVHSVIKGYSDNAVDPNFYSNNWNESWTGNPLTYHLENRIGSLGLTVGEVEYLSGLSGMQSGIQYYIDLTDRTVMAGSGPVTNDNAAATGFSSFKVYAFNSLEETIGFAPDPVDSFGIIVEHFMVSYFDEYNHTFSVLAAFNDLEGSEPTPDPVPEPATLFLIGSGLAGLSIIRKRRNNAQEG